MSEKEEFPEVIKNIVIDKKEESITLIYGRRKITPTGIGNLKSG